MEDLVGRDGMHRVADFESGSKRFHQGSIVVHETEDDLVFSRHAPVPTHRSEKICLRFNIDDVEEVVVTDSEKTVV